MLLGNGNGRISLIKMSFPPPNFNIPPPSIRPVLNFNSSIPPPNILFSVPPPNIPPPPPQNKRPNFSRPTGDRYDSRNKYEVSKKIPSRRTDEGSSSKSSRRSDKLVSRNCFIINTSFLFNYTFYSKLNETFC